MPSCSANARQAAWMAGSAFFRRTQGEAEQKANLPKTAKSNTLVQVAIAYAGNAIGTLEPLAQAGVALVHVIGDPDDVVRAEESTALVEERYRKLGGWQISFGEPSSPARNRGRSEAEPHRDLSRII